MTSVKRHFPLQPEGLFGCFANNSGCSHELHSGNDDGADRHKHAVLDNAVPDSNISAASLLCDGNIHVKFRYAIGVEVRSENIPAHSHTPYFYWLREQQTPALESTQLNSSLFCRLVNTSAPEVANLRHGCSTLELCGSVNLRRFA